MKPIIMSTEDVRALLDGRKTTMRIPIKLPAYVKQSDTDDTYTLIEEDGDYSRGWSIPDLISNNYIKRPYYKHDVLWVRETWKPQDYQFIDGMWNCAIVYKAGGMEGRVYWPDGTDSIYERYGIWRPSTHMPREAARLFLRVTDVRVERVQDISPEDCESEGYFEAEPVEPRPRSWFSAVWDARNTKRGYGWDSNPWVWVIEFECVEKGVE
jgi:hypothetical protein